MAPGTCAMGKKRGKPGTSVREAGMGVLKEPKLAGEAGKTVAGLWQGARPCWGLSGAPAPPASDSTQAVARAPASRLGVPLRILGSWAPCGSEDARGPLRCSPASSPSPGNWLSLLG